MLPTNITPDDLSLRQAEVVAKLATVRALARAHGLDAAHLTRVTTTAWLTAGATTFVDVASEDAAFSILVTPDEALVLTDPIEAPRLREEERLDALGFRIVEEPWHQRGSTVALMGATLRLGTDRPGALADLTGPLRQARAALIHSGERGRLIEGGHRAAAAMLRAITALTPGMTEHEAASTLAGAACEQGGTPIVVLVGSDERIWRFRHPLPTAKPIERYVMLVLCFRYRGLVSALTRSIHWDSLPQDVRERSQAVARVQARMIAATQSERTLGEIFEVTRQAYAAEGYPEAIDEHHQGGRIGYLSRETLALPGDPTPLGASAFAWNPSLRGVKAEDTQLGQQLTTILPPEQWPRLDFTLDGQPWSLPAILER